MAATIVTRNPADSREIVAERAASDPSDVAEACAAAAQEGRLAC